jgi:hypothetical protein
MPVTNPSAIAFCNDRVRPAADRLAQAYYRAVQVYDEWFASGMDAIILTGGGEVDDGAAIDGRHIITADDVLLLITRLQEMKADYQATNNAKLNTVLKPAVNVSP